MIMKKKTIRGFTLIEVSLFLAITGVLLIGFLAATWSSISRQRTNDLIQSFSDFLRSQYSAVTSVQNNGDGNSDHAIYGRLITFGEEESVVYAYDVVGEVRSSDELSRKTIPEMLNDVNADIVKESPLASGLGSEYEVYNQIKYELAYNASVRTRIKTGETSFEDYNDATGGVAILITRSPQSGGVHTFFFSRNFSIQGQLAFAEANVLGSGMKFFEFDASAGSGDFRVTDVDFCLSARELIGSREYDIRLKADAANATGVNVINLDSEEDNRCEN